MTEQDLDSCLALTTDRFLYDESGLAALRRMWQQALVSKAGLAFVIVDTAASDRIAFFGSAVFVTDEKAKDYHELRRPAIARAMVQEFASGKHAFLSRCQIAEANGGLGLNLIATHHGYEERYDESDERVRAATYDGVAKYWVGWNLRTYTNEVFAVNPRRDADEMGAALGFRIERYTGEQLARASIPPDREPRVWLATRQDALDNPAALALQTIFSSFSPPRFHFSFAEQDMLELALEGNTDESIAQALSESPPTIKKRFRAIYTKVQEAGGEPSALIFEATRTAGVRGGETRRRLLNYLRAHRYELRPYAHSNVPFRQ